MAEVGIAWEAKFYPTSQEISVETSTFASQTVAMRKILVFCSLQVRTNFCVPQLSAIIIIWMWLLRSPGET